MLDSLLLSSSRLNPFVAVVSFTGRLTVATPLVRLAPASSKQKWGLPGVSFSNSPFVAKNTHKDQEQSEHQRYRYPKRSQGSMPVARIANEATLSLNFTAYYKQTSTSVNSFILFAFAIGGRLP